MDEKELRLAYGSAVANLPVDPGWLARYREAILEPELPIIDPHHHLWDRPGFRYLLPELLEDIGSGHNVRATVFVECASRYRASGDSAFRPVGETEFAAGMAAMSRSGQGGDARVCAGIVAYADLGLGRSVQPVLEAHLAAGGGRVCGIRQTTLWHEAVEMLTPNPYPKRPLAPGMLGEARFREGFACLARYGLSYDAWLYHTQLAELAALARAFPQIPIVVGHTGGAARVGPYAGRAREVFADWTVGIRELARCPNVQMKIGGFGMRLAGYDLRASEAPLPSEALAELWRPYVDTCLQAFGPARCMFESNFPVDKASFSYAVLWNAYKRLSAACSAEEKRALFGGTAQRVYRLNAIA